MVGQKIGKYRVVSKLGRGGMGTVYKAVDETLDREVAIKCLNPDIGDPEVLKRFRAEAVTLARLNHPNIATLFELTEHDDQLLMVMEFVRGETFDKVSHRTGPMPVDRAAHLCGQVFDALAHAHRAGIVHRDLKPANLMLTESGLVKVMDFGLARMAGTEHLTNDGYMVGTPAYMSPEQVLGWEIDGRADLYAMGVVLFRLISGQLPFKADSGIAMAQKQINDPPTPVRQLRTELSWEVEEVLKRALAKPPGDRYQTADSFKAALSAVAAVPSGVSADALPTLALSRTAEEPGLETTLPLAPTPVVTARPPTIASPVPPAAASAHGATLPPSQAKTAPMPPVVVPPAPPVPPPAASSTRTSPAGRRLPVAAMVLIGAAVLAGVPATMIWRDSTTPPEATPGAVPAPSAPVTPSTASAAPAVSAPAPAVDPAPVTPAPPMPVETAKAPAAPAPRPPRSDAPARAAGGPAAPSKDNAPTPAPEPEPAHAPNGTAPPRANLPAVTFGKMKLLTFDEGKSRDSDASLHLGPDGLRVLDEDGKKTLLSAPYQDVVGLFHSHSREPRWATPDGTSVAVGKAGGKFSFFKGVPDWVTVRTKQVFIPLRVQDDDLDRVIAALEARTGAKVVRAR